MSACKGYNPKSGNPCSNPVITETVVVGCKHEHLSERPFCKWHAADLVTGNMLCGDCLEAGCDCRLRVA